MFLVVDPITRFHIFTDKDPRDDGFQGAVVADVRLDDKETLLARSQDATTAVPCLGRSAEDEKHYRVFTCMKDCRSVGFDPIATVYATYETWSEYQQEV